MIDPFGRPAGVAAFAVLVGLAAWAGQVDRPAVVQALADPARHAGETVAIWREARVVETRPDGAVRVWEKASGPGAVVTVRGVTERADPGTSISLVGTFVPPDAIAATAYRLHRTRFVKVWVSLPVLAWLAWAFVTRVRITRGGLEAR